MRETALSCRASSVGTRPHSQRSLPRSFQVLVITQIVILLLSREGQRKVSGAAAGVEGVHEAVLLPGQIKIPLSTMIL